MHRTKHSHIISQRLLHSKFRQTHHSISMTNMKIAVLGHYTTPNLGDEASAAAVIENLSERYPEAEIVCIALKPDVAAKRYAKKAYPLRYIPPCSPNDRSNSIPQGKNSSHAIESITSPEESNEQGWKSNLKNKIKQFSWVFNTLKSIINIIDILRSLPHIFINEIRFLKSSYSVLEDIDIICVGGSGTLQDLWGGPWEHPYTLFKWSWLAKKHHCKFLFLSCGAVPFITHTGSFFIRKALDMASYVSVRDEDSKNLLKSIGVKNNIQVRPDVAHSHPAVRSKIKSPYIGAKPLRIGINPTPVYGEEYETPEGKLAYQNYIDMMAKFLTYLTQNQCQPVYFANHPRDETVLKDIMKKANITEEILIASETDQLQEHIYTLDIAVASRFHGIVFPLAQCIPTIAICKDQKQVELMNNYDLSKYSLPLEHCTLDQLTACFEVLTANRVKIHEQLKALKQANLQSLDQQYELITKK